MSRWDAPHEGPYDLNPYYQNNLMHLNRQYAQPSSSQVGVREFSNTQQSSENQSTQGSSGSFHRTPIDISNSNLQPTAREFVPWGANGAVRRNNGRGYNRHYDRGASSYQGNQSHQSQIEERTDSFKDRKNHKKNYGRGQGQGYRGYGHSSRENWDRKPQGRNGAFRNNGKDSGQEKKYDWGSKKLQKIKSSADNKTKDVKVADATKPQQLDKKINAASQRERLEQMVLHKMLECLVCCEKLKHTDKVWSCKQCFHIFHLYCIIKWANSSKLKNGWRCPACQNVLENTPREYRCFCDKAVDPPLEPGFIPHSCGDTCMRKGRHCDHSCTLLCHPGPCPDCSVMVKRQCECSTETMVVKCSSDLDILCGNICNKTIACGVHKCIKKCHTGDCNDCTEKVIQECYCGKEGRKVNCTRNVGDRYSCNSECSKPLGCGNHNCTKLCHEGPCDDCPMDPKLFDCCPCGQTKLQEERKSCLDPVPCCDKECNKKLKCGQPSDPHLCQSKCHKGPCPQCPLSTMVRCRCGHMDKEIPCSELTTKADDARCQKKCTKKRFCTKHKCNQLCCIDVLHQCNLPCNRMLSCGTHRCEYTCHRGSCPPCWITSFEELYCECGANVIYPPVPCGTRPPPCSMPCSRVRPCGHQPHHTCHSDRCPPCTVLTKKQCHGGHETRNTIPCHQKDFSCGLKCNKELSCGRHRCIQICHPGECETQCEQPCTEPRPDCEHNCNLPCHEPPCPENYCKETVVVTCQCGERSSKRLCMQLVLDYQKVALNQLASRMADLNLNREQLSVDISDIVAKNRRTGPHKILDCDEECRLVERNRRLAIGLQIRNPDLSSKLTPRYSDTMKNWAKKDPKFCQQIHDKLTDLVKLAKQSKQKSRSLSFECMKAPKRQFVKEYCEHFGCESAAYDEEPNRNIVATAYRDKSWLPNCSVIEFLQRENRRKVPGPVLNISSDKSSEAVSLNSLPKAGASASSPPAVDFVDYFDNPPS